MQSPTLYQIFLTFFKLGCTAFGAIEVLEQAGIQPDMIVGTSAGSIVGSIYASGKPAIELRNIALSMKANDVRDFRIDLKGFFEKYLSCFDQLNFTVRTF
jgi:predicted acylesterase/phospholipase RssA